MKQSRVSQSVNLVMLAFVRPLPCGFMNERDKMTSLSPENLAEVIVRIERLENRLFGATGAEQTIPHKTCSVDEACKLVPLGKTSIYKLIAENAIESFKIRNSRRIVIASLPGFAAK